MEVMLEDIARTLDATYVSLPGYPHESFSYPTPGSSHFEPQTPRYRAPLPLPEELPVGIGRLRLEDPSMGPAHPSRAREVSTPYRGMPPILTPPRSLERQLA